MKAEYIDDSSLPAGNGLLVLTGNDIPQGPWQLSIQRSSDQKFLGGKTAGQWLGEAAQFTTGQAELLGDSLQIALPPAIVDSLDQKDQYRLILRGADDQPHSARLTIDRIAHSAGNSRNNTARPGETGAPDQTASVKNRPEKNIREMKPEVLEMPDWTIPENGPDIKKRSRWTIPLLLLLGAICIVWWYVEQRSGKTLQFRPAQTQSQKASPKTGALVEAETAVREFFAGSNLTPVNALALARSLPANTPAEKDAVYRLYYYAAGSENPQALLEYGNCVDPSTPQWGTIEKNGLEAWQVYEKAARDHPEEAREAMQKLKAWLEKNAASGNREAASWLGSIK